MRRHPVTVAVALAAALAATVPACTLIGLGAGAAATGLHNSSATEKDQWGYAGPLVLGGLFGLVTDYFLYDALKRQFSKPWS